MGLFRQHQEGRLERVLDIVLASEHGAAGGQDHRAVARDQGLKGYFFIRRTIAGQELAVPERADRPDAEEIAEVPDGGP